MSKAKYLIDTVIIIDHLNGVKKASNWLKKYGSDANISVITRAEVLTGASDREKFSIQLLLDNFHCLSITKEISDIAASLRQQYKWKLPDAFQAALAKQNGLKLITRNMKDFPKEFEFVKIPYQI